MATHCSLTTQIVFLVKKKKKQKNKKKQQQQQQQQKTNIEKPTNDKFKKNENNSTYHKTLSEELIGRKS